MRRYFIIILLLLVLGEAEAQGQDPFNWWRTNNNRVAPVSYDADALVYFDRVETAGGTISNGRKLLISNFFVMLKDSLNSDTLTNDFDEFWFYAAEDSITGNTGWLRGWTSVTTGSATSTFKVDSGWIGQTNARLNTTFFPSTDAIVYEATSSTFGYYLMTNNNMGATYTIDALNSWIIRVRYVSAVSHNSNAEGTAWGTLSYLGFFSAWRIHAWSNGYYWNDIQSPAYVSDAKYGAGLPQSDVVFGGNINGSNMNLVSFCYFGRYFTRDELNKINRCVEWYLNELNGFPYEYDDRYCLRANQFFARCYYGTGTILSDLNKQWYNDSIFIPLQDSGLISSTTRAGDSLVALYSFNLAHAQNEEVAKLNLLDNRYYCVNVNGVTFTDSGCIGNGTTSYLNTYFNPVLDSAICKLNSASLGIFVQDGAKYKEIQLYPEEIGGHTTEGSCIGLSANGGLFAVNNVYENITVDTNDYISTFIIIRQNSTTINLLRNGEYYNSKSANSTVKYNGYYLILATYFWASPSRFSTKMLSFASIGSGLSFDKARKLSNIENTSLKGYGYNVY